MTPVCRCKPLFSLVNDNEPSGQADNEGGKSTKLLPKLESTCKCRVSMHALELITRCINGATTAIRCAYWKAGQYFQSTYTGRPGYSPLLVLQGTVVRTFGRCIKWGLLLFAHRFPLLFIANRLEATGCHFFLVQLRFLARYHWLSYFCLFSA